MGYDAETWVTMAGKRLRAKVQLESNELIIRGPARQTIPLRDVKKAVAGSGCLSLDTPSGTVEVELGEQSAKWAHRIANPPSRLDKLGVKSDMTVVVLGDPGDGFLDELAERGARISRRSSATTPAQIVFLLVRTRDALIRLASLRDAIVPDGAIWVLRPKGKTPVTEADSMAAGKQAGLVDVKVVAFSPELTAEKYVIPVALRPKRPRARR